jgi:hypothetical protein
VLGQFIDKLFCLTTLLFQIKGKVLCWVKEWG